MPIAALPPGTVSAIGSTQALTDAASLVKELIDNAIDARAIAISVEISANTLDEVRVKDNGHGIAPEDRSMMCIRHCTSKIRDLTDLHEIGGRSLGFRGEALASAAEMSGSLTISTRIEGEATAAEVVFDRQGQISSEKRISLPVGTTVRVGKFLETLPVRKQTAMKTAIKTLGKTRRNLQAYALARPQLRLSLRILKAKTDKDSWKYPKTGQVGITKFPTTTINAAIDVFGKKIMDQCQWSTSTWSSSGKEIGGNLKGLNTSTIEVETYTFEAVLARDDCDGSIISNVGQFISVDARPVSSRGTFKQIVSRYKSSLRSNGANYDGSKIVDPILCMNIVCPKGSYDTNVEPAKDDVLFANPGLVLQLVEKFFSSVYGEPQPDFPKAKSQFTPESNGIDLMLATRKQPLLGSPMNRLPIAIATPARSKQLRLGSLPQREPTSPAAVASITDLQGKQSNLEKTTTETPSSLRLPEPGSEISGEALLPSEPSKRPTWEPSMYAEDDDMDESVEHVDHNAQPLTDDNTAEDTALQNVHVSNPWVTAKLNAPFGPPLSNRQADERIHQLPTPGRQRGDAGTHTDLSSDDLMYGVNEPATDMTTHGHFRAPSCEDGVHKLPDPCPSPQKARGPRHATETLTKVKESNREHHAFGALDTWVQRSPNSSANLFGQDASALVDIEPGGPYCRGDFVSARLLPQGTALSDILDVPQRVRRRPAPQIQQQGVSRKPFVPPVHDPDRVWFDSDAKANRKHPQHVSPREEPWRSGADATLTPRDDEVEDEQTRDQASFQRSIHPDLAITLDYEARKQRAELQRRESLRQQAATQKQDARIAAGALNARTSPHKNRQYKAIAALHDGNETTTGSSDPRTSPAFEADDPRAYLLREQQREAAQLEAGLGAPRLKRRKTTLLPFESMREDHHVRDLTLPVKMLTEHIDKLVGNSILHDEYVHSGEDTEAFSSPSMHEISHWEVTLKAIVKASYRIEGMAAEEEMDGNLDVDLQLTLHEHAIRNANLEAEEKTSLEGQASQTEVVAVND